jgi:DnaJ-like protein
MMAVPRRSQRAADEGSQTHVNGKVASSEPASNGAEPASSVVAIEETAEPEAEWHESPSEADTSLLPVLAEQTALAAPSVSSIRLDPGLYGVLGLDALASDALIKATYRQRAAKLIGNGSHDNQALKQLNVAYEVLGNPVRRAEYDRLRLAQALVPAGAPTPIRPGAKATTRVTKRRRPRHAVQPHYPGLGDVVVVLTVVGLAVVVGALLIPRLSVNLSALNALQAVLPLSNNQRRVLDVTVTAVPTPEPTATPLPSVSAQFSSSTVSVSNPTPAPNSQETVQVHLKRDGQPVAGTDVWATVTYRTTEERWPPTGAVKTDSTGAANITFNIGSATPNYPVTVHVYSTVDGQQLSWTTTFTPH